MTYDLSPWGHFPVLSPMTILFPLASMTKHSLSLGLTNPTAARFFSNHRLSTPSSLFALSLSDLVSFTLLSLAIITHAHALNRLKGTSKSTRLFREKAGKQSRPQMSKALTGQRRQTSRLVGFEVQQGSHLQERSHGRQQDEADPCTVHAQTICLMPL